MIIQTLVNYYDQMVKNNLVSRPGWQTQRIQYAIEINDDGELLQVIPLESVDSNNKPIRREFNVPLSPKKASAIAPKYLWGNSAYMLGVFPDQNELEKLDEKTKQSKEKRAKDCFESSKEYHLSLLNESKDPFAIAICKFFSNLDLSKISSNNKEAIDSLPGSVNLLFMLNNEFDCNNDALSDVWNNSYNAVDESIESKEYDLVTGEIVVPENIHPAIKGLYGAQQAGAALMSYNSPAFCSYGKKQNVNAPIGKLTAFKYTTALNSLLKENRYQLGKRETLIYWAVDAEVQYQDAFGCILNDNYDNVVTNSDLEGMIKNLAKGKPYGWKDSELNPDNEFYILAVSPNASRIVVRFFLKNSFGAFVKNVDDHNNRLAIMQHGKISSHLSLWNLINETARDENSIIPNLESKVLESILQGTYYPSSLYQQVLLRIKATREVTWKKAAIIKAYFLKNSKNDDTKEVSTMSLNEESTSVPYILGRLFALLEDIQYTALNVTTVKDRYFNSACTTPSVVFPLLLKLKNSHMKVLMRDKPGLAISQEKQVVELLGRIGDTFPKHLSLEEQGAFILGYYHQTQKRFNKKDEVK